MNLHVDDLRSAGWPESIIREYDSQDSTDAITIRSLSKNAGNTQILDNLTFSVRGGEVFGIVGRSGAGKTTLLHALAGLVQTTGTIKYTQHRIGLATQQPSFYPDLTVKENILYYGRIAHVRKSEAKILIEQLNLKPYLERYARDLSGGIQKKLDLLIAFLGDPQIVLLDEPTADLDPISRAEIWTFLKSHAGEKTIILASHQLRELEPLCNRVAVIDKGKLVGIGSADQFRERIGSRYLVRLEFESHDYAEYAQKHPGWDDQGSYLITANTQQEVFTILQDVLASQESIVAVSVEHPSLRHLFSTMIQ